MPKTDDVDKARRILPTNAAPGVAELNSNFTVIIAPVNPNAEGEDCTPTRCGSIDEVAAEFKPTMEFQVKKVDNIGADKVDESTVSVTMKYGQERGQVMNDFTAENLTVKAKTADSSERVLLDQQLTYLSLEDLQERLRDQKVAQLFEKNKDGLIQSLTAEIDRLKKVIQENEANKLME